MLTEESPRTFTVVDEITEWTPEHYRPSASMMAHVPNPLPLKLWLIYAPDANGDPMPCAVVCAADADAAKLLLAKNIQWREAYEYDDLETYFVEELKAGSQWGVVLLDGAPE